MMLRPNTPGREYDKVVLGKANSGLSRKHYSIM